MFIVASWIVFFILLLITSSCIVVIVFTLFIKVDWKSFMISLTLTIIDSCHFLFFESKFVIIELLLSLIIVLSLSFQPVSVDWCNQMFCWWWLIGCRNGFWFFKMMMIWNHYFNCCWLLVIGYRGDGWCIWYDEGLWGVGWFFVMRLLL